MNGEAQMKPTYHKISPRVLTDEKPGHVFCYDTLTRCSMRCRNCSQSVSVISRAGLSIPACNSFSNHDTSRSASSCSTISRETASVTSSSAERYLPLATFSLTARSSRSGMATFMLLSLCQRTEFHKMLALELAARSTSGEGHELH